MLILQFGEDGKTTSRKDGSFPHRGSLPKLARADLQEFLNGSATHVTGCFICAFPHLSTVRTERAAGAVDGRQAAHGQA